MLSTVEKLSLQKEASHIKKALQENISVVERLTKQKRWSEILKALKGIPLNATEPSSNVAPPKLVTDDLGRNIDDKANEAATSSLSDKKEPTEKQKIAGVYKKGNFKLFGLDLVIENPKGSVRSGKDADGNEWSITMKHHYGDIKGTKGADDDPLDVFVGETDNSEQVYVIDQLTQDKTFDEHKVMIGFDSLNAARKAYFANYDEGWQGLGAIKVFTLDAFKTWAFTSKKSKPVAYSSGELPQSQHRNVIKPEAYQKLTREVLKQKMKEFVDAGISIETVKQVMSHWLAYNIKNAV